MILSEPLSEEQRRNTSFTTTTMHLPRTKSSQFFFFPLIVLCFSFKSSDSNCNSFFFFNRKKQPKPVDLTEVLDFRSVLECYLQNGALPPGVIVLHENFTSPVFSLQNRPGFFFFFYYYLSFN